MKHMLSANSIPFVIPDAIWQGLDKRELEAGFLLYSTQELMMEAFAQHCQIDGGDVDGCEVVISIGDGGEFRYKSFDEHHSLLRGVTLEKFLNDFSDV